MKNSLLFICLMVFLVQPVSAQHQISGFVVSMETAGPIEGATVFLKDQYGLPLDSHLRTQTDSDGYYRIDNIAPDSYTLHSWNAYESDEETYAYVVQSKILNINDDITVDLVYSENFVLRKIDEKMEKERLIKLASEQEELMDSIRQALWSPDVLPRSSDTVARFFTGPKIYLNSKLDTVFWYYLQKIDPVNKRVIR